MITDHLKFLYSEANEMVSQEKLNDLRNMYILLKPITDGLKDLIVIFLNHIKNEGIETISKLKGDNVNKFFIFFYLYVYYHKKKKINLSIFRYIHNLWKIC